LYFIRDITERQRKGGGCGVGWYETEPSYSQFSHDCSAAWVIMGHFFTESLSLSFHSAIIILTCNYVPAKAKAKGIKPESRETEKRINDAFNISLDKRNSLGPNLGA